MGEVLQRPGVNAGVLSDVETMTVQPVRSDLREQRLDQGTSRMGGPSGIQRVRHQREILLQLARRAVARGLGLDPSPHEADLQTQRLVRVAAAILLPHLWQLLTIALERGVQ